MPPCRLRHAWLSLAHAAPAALPLWGDLKRLEPCPRTLGERLAATLDGDDDAFADALIGRYPDDERERAAGRPARLPQRLLGRLRSSAVADQVARALEREARFARHHLITPVDAAYPERLARIDDPPPMLGLTGCREALARPGVAIVGARRATRHGLELASAMAEDLAATGLSVLSGLALGIDAAAHRGALQADGVSVAVLATGPERIYPPRHAELAERLCERGALVTEFPAGSRLQRRHFPIRNRLGSALSDGVVLIEAAELSGTLSTAAHARRQNREVMVVPGRAGELRSRGGESLLRDGATPVVTASDIVAAIAPALRHELDALSARAGGQPSAPRETGSGDTRRGSEGDGAPGGPDDPDAQHVLDELNGAQTPVEVLQWSTGWPVGRLMAALGLLELHGFARRDAGGGYSLCLSASHSAKRAPDRAGAPGQDRAPNVAGLDAHPIFDLD